MASSSNTETDVGNSRWYCHVCEEETEAVSEGDVVCSRCRQGFVEQLLSGARESSNGAGPLLNSPPRALSRAAPYDRAGRLRHMRRLRIAVRHVAPLTRQRQSIHDFVNRMIATATVDENASGTGSSSSSTQREQPMNVVLMPPIRRVGSNYIVHVNRLDNAIIMLLNQLDESGSGAPPASTEQIDALPTMSVIQSHVDAKLNCNICMEDFELDEPVRSLPCKHFYHPVCISTWLQLHGTCPVCRQSVNDLVPPVTDDSSDTTRTLSTDTAADLDS